MGSQVLRLKDPPKEVAKRQALAAIGQGALMRVYTDFFSVLSIVRLHLAFTSIVTSEMHARPANP
jgi:glutamate 5-kinase